MTFLDKSIELFSIRKFLIVLLLMVNAFVGSAQSDTTSSKKFIEILQKNKISNEVINLFIVTEDTSFTVKSEDPYKAYEGKIIRKINIEHIGFERDIIDTSKNVISYVVRTANRLHRDTKDWVVRDNLFIREGKPLNSFRLADNERYLRNLNFILDCRIYVKPIRNSPDSVDLIVVTRDVFSLGLSFEPSSLTKYSIKPEEFNLGGMGQRVQLTTLIDGARNPHTGLELLYQKTNLFGSFIDASLDYSRINSALAYGSEAQSSYSFQLNRSLFMPYTQWAGGLTLSRNKSINVYSKSDSLFEHYGYSVQDYWAGYSFGSKKNINTISENRNRKFIALRTSQQQYFEVPTFFANSYHRLLYHNRTSALLQFTFFRQDFYKTRYVLGFGRTEDIPYGYRASFTGGWENEQQRLRGYLGAEIYRSLVNSNGAFFTYTFRAASFYKNQQTEDALLSINLTRYSKIYAFRKFKLRHQLDVGYASQFNQKEKRPLDINDANGITNFRPDSLLGSTRINFRYESIVFTPWQFLGFHVATIARFDLAYLSKSVTALIDRSDIFTSFSGGFRIRNENLIFNTIETRIIYYPRTIEAINHVNFSVQGNLKIKYPSTLVNAPSTVYN